MGPKGDPKGDPKVDPKGDPKVSVGNFWVGQDIPAEPKINCKIFIR